jgi:hypothetical protein
MTMRTKRYLTLLYALTALTASAQKYKTKDVTFYHYQYPLVQLDTARYRTYSVSGSLPDYAGGGYGLARMAFAIGNLRRSGTAGGDIEVLVDFPYYTEDGLVGRPAVVQGSKTEKVNGVETTYTVFSYQGSFYQGYEYTVRDNAKGADLGTGRDRRQIKVATDWYRTSEEAVRNWETALRTQMGQAAQNLLREAANVVGQRLAAIFYTGKAQARADVYYMKDKEDFADLDSAAQIALAAYATINETQLGLHNDFIKTVAPAEAVWLRALAEYGTGEKKGRINAKAANIILFNLAWAAYWKNDFAAALGYADKADENGKRDGWVQGFEAKVKERKERMLNGEVNVQ